MSQKRLSGSEDLNKEHIINKAIELFSNNGFSATRIDDITNAIGIAKGTFYLHFKSKRDLLMDCMEQLTTRTFSKEAWEDIRKETDLISREKKRFIALLKVFDTFSGSLNLVKSCFQSNDPGLVKKASDTYRMMVNPLRKDFRWAMEHGLVQKQDEEIFSSMMFGIGESVGYMLKMDPRYSGEKVAEVVMDFFSKGLGLSAGENPEKSKARSLYWDVCDCDGSKIRVSNLRFAEMDYLLGNFGRGELRIYLQNVRSISLQETDNLCLATVSMKNGENVTLKIDGNISLSGESEFGQHILPLKFVSSISLIFGDGSS